MEIFVSVLLGAITSLVIQFSKKTGMSVSQIFLGVALLCGLAWTLIEVFAPVGLTDNIYDFSSKVIGSAAIVYSLFSSVQKKL